MKKNILLGVIILILIFSYPTKKKYKINNVKNIESTFFLTLECRKEIDAVEEQYTKISNRLYEKNSVQNQLDTAKNKNTFQHSSRNNKGKIMLSNDHYIISKTKLD